MRGGAKLAMADREAWYGDVDDVPVDDLLSSTYAAERRALIGDTASRALRPGSPGGRPPRLPAFIAAGAARAAAGAGRRHRRTDRRPARHHPRRHLPRRRRRPLGQPRLRHPVRRLAAELPGRSPPSASRLGTRAQMFWLERGLPNSLAPGKRPRTTLTPVPRPARRRPHPGLRHARAATSRSSGSCASGCAHVVDGLDLQAAIDAPAWHTDRFPSSFYPRDMTPGEVVVESRIGDAVVADLRRRGHDVTVAGPWTLGRLSAVSRDPETGILRAAANARGHAGLRRGR